MGLDAPRNRTWTQCSVPIGCLASQTVNSDAVVEAPNVSYSACWWLVHPTVRGIVARGAMPTADVLEAELLA